MVEFGIGLFIGVFLMCALFTGRDKDEWWRIRESLRMVRKIYE